MEEKRDSRKRGFLCLSVSRIGNREYRTVCDD